MQLKQEAALVPSFIIPTRYQFHSTLVSKPLQPTSCIKQGFSSTFLYTGGIPFFAFALLYLFTCENKLYCYVHFFVLFCISQHATNSLPIPPTRNQRSIYHLIDMLAFKSVRTWAQVCFFHRNLFSCVCADQLYVLYSYILSSFFLVCV